MVSELEALSLASSAAWEGVKLEPDPVTKGRAQTDQNASSSSMRPGPDVLLAAGHARLPAHLSALAKAIASMSSRGRSSHGGTS